MFARGRWNLSEVRDRFVFLRVFCFVLCVHVRVVKTDREIFQFLIAWPFHAPIELFPLTIISSKSCNLVSRVKSPSETLCKGQPMQFEYLWLNGVPVPDLDCRSLPQRNDIHPSHPTCPSPRLLSRSSLIVEGHVCHILFFLAIYVISQPILSLLLPLSFSPACFTSLYVFCSFSLYLLFTQCIVLVWKSPIPDISSSVFSAPFLSFSHTAVMHLVWCFS